MAVSPSWTVGLCRLQNANCKKPVVARAFTALLSRHNFVHSTRSATPGCVLGHARAFATKWSMGVGRIAASSADNSRNPTTSTATPAVGTPFAGAYQSKEITQLCRQRGKDLQRLPSSRPFATVIRKDNDTNLYKAVEAGLVAFRKGKDGSIHLVAGKDFIEGQSIFCASPQEHALYTNYDWSAMPKDEDWICLDHEFWASASVGLYSGGTYSTSGGRNVGSDKIEAKASRHIRSGETLTFDYSVLEAEMSNGLLCTEGGYLVEQLEAEQVPAGFAAMRRMYIDSH